MQPRARGSLSSTRETFGHNRHGCYDQDRSLQQGVKLPVPCTIKECPEFR
jgi:hypothetical protein